MARRRTDKEKQKQYNKDKLAIFFEYNGLFLGVFKLAVLYSFWVLILIAGYSVACLVFGV